MTTILDIRTETLSGAAKHYKAIKVAIAQDKGATPIDILEKCTRIYNDYYDLYDIEFLEQINK